MRKKIKIILTIMLMITALIFNAKGTYAKGLIDESAEDNDIHWNMQINEINVDLFDEKTRGQTMYEYFNSDVESMCKVDRENLLFATRTYRVQDGIQNGFEKYRTRTSEGGAIQGIMNPTLENGQAVFSNKLKNTYQIFPTPDVQTGENEIFKKIYTDVELQPEKNDNIYSYNKECFYPNLEYDTFFTAKMQTTFKMTSDGKDNGKDLYFEVGGSDDIYVYIDGMLIIDLGGIHGDIYAKANFADCSIFYQGIYNENIENFEYGIEQKFEGLSEGEHTITVFYARRGVKDNVFRMEYNLSNNPIKTEDLPNEEDTFNIIEENHKEDDCNVIQENHEEDDFDVIKENQNENIFDIQEEIKKEEEIENENNPNGSNNKNANSEEISQNRNDKREEKKNEENQLQRARKQIKNKKLNQTEIKDQIELKSKEPKALKTIETTDINDLNTQNISVPNEKNSEEEIVNRTQNIKEPQSSKINFEDNSQGIIIKQINKLSIIHVILIAIVIILQLAILLKK